MQVSAAFEPTIVAREMEPMVAFYRDVLGMTLFSMVEIDAAASLAAGLTGGGYVMARLDTAGGDRLKIAVPYESPSGSPAGEQVMRRHGFAYLTYVVPDVRAVIRRVEAAGGTVRTGHEPIAFRPGVVELAFAEDPEGNCIEFVQRNDLATYRPKRGAPT